MNLMAGTNNYKIAQASVTDFLNLSYSPLVLKTVVVLLLLLFIIIIINSSLHLYGRLFF